MRHVLHRRPARAQGRLLVIGLFVSVFAVALPAGGQDPEAPLPFLVGAEVDVVYQLVTEGMVETGSCPSGNLTLTADAVVFDKDRGESRICAKVEDRIPVPPVAGRVRISGTHSVTGDVGGEAVFSLAVPGRTEDVTEQWECRFGGPRSDPGGVCDAPDRHGLLTHDGVVSLCFHWYGPDLKDLCRRFSSGSHTADINETMAEGMLTLRDLRVGFYEAPVARGSAIAFERIGNASTGLVAVSAEIPAHLFETHHVIEGMVLRFRFIGLVDVVGVLLPDGTTAPRIIANYPPVVDQQVVEVPVSAPGRHALVIRDGRFYLDANATGQTVVTVPSAPVSLEASVLAASVGVVPFVAATLALRGNWRLNMTAPALAPARWWAGFTVVVVAILGYLAMGTWSILRFGLAPLVVWPLTLSAWLFYGATSIVTLLFLAIWLRTDHVRDTRVRSDIEASSEALRQEESKAAGLERLLHGVSHDLKTPLIALDWLANDLESELHEADPEAVRAFLQRIRSNVGGMERLVEELLELSRIRQGTDPEAVSRLDDVLEGIGAELAEPLRARGASLSIDAGRGPPVRMEAGHARRVLRNLLTNAIKYGRDGGKIQVTVQEKAGPDGTRAVVHVDDDGPGVPIKQREAIFGMFTRGTGHDAVSGTGLGLALVKEIVHTYGGRVGVTESPLGGARFWIEMPAGKEVRT
ncbi:MAG: HAMP domain-containing histidine kinase [Euryarchaeota archaeon]|nr:HAMP domain-containing histidine kinase [Euryarchaeota archaeon]